MAGLRRRGCNSFASGNALVRRQRGALLDVLDQQVECTLRVRLQELESLATLSRNAQARIYIGFDKHTAAPAE